MNRIIIFVTILAIYLLLTAMTYYPGRRRKTHKLDQRATRVQLALKALPARERRRVEESLLILEKHPDLRNGFGAMVSARYADQIATITERYAKITDEATVGYEDQLMQALFEEDEDHEDHEPNERDKSAYLLSEGIGTIERKIEKALTLKGAEAQDELDVYVRFLREAD